MRYKIGDKVRIKPNLEDFGLYGDINFTGAMKKYEVVTIRYVSARSYSVRENSYIYNDEMILCLESDYEKPNPEAFEKKMKEIAETKDIEHAHIEMDELMVQVLCSLGFSKGVKIFCDKERWYA